jgi:hypothetical protein
MTEILTQLGIENVTAVLAAVMAFIGICAFLTSLVTEGLKNVKYIVAVVITTPVFLALMAFMDQVVEWYMVFASFLTSFVVAKVATSGWDDVTELAKRMLRN